MNDLTISRLARSANVKTETIRYYERLGLLRQPLRSENGYRHYDDHDTAVLRFIRNTQTLGFTLKEIKLLLEWHHNDLSRSHDIQALITKKLSTIHKKIQQLKAIETKLQHYNKGHYNHDGDRHPLLDQLWMGNDNNNTIAPENNT